MIRLIVKALGWLWGNRAELARDVEQLVDEPGQPLSHADAERIAEFGRHAGHEPRPKPPGP